jgi:hypothetical protein
MRMKGFGSGLLAAVILASGGGCKKSASEGGQRASGTTNQPALTLAQVHWLGKKQIATETNAARFMSLWDLPESVSLEGQTLDKVALVMAGVSLGTNEVTESVGTNRPTLGTNYQALVARHPAAARVRPLLEDLVREEWYLEMQQAPNRPVELALAIRLDEQRDGLWRTNLAAALESQAGIRPTPTTNGWTVQVQNPKSKVQRPESVASRPWSAAVARSGQWTIFGLLWSPVALNPAPIANPLVTVFADRIQRSQTPVAASEADSSLQMDSVTRRLHSAPGSPAATNVWLEANVDLRRIAGALALGWKPPGALTRVFLTVAGQPDHLRTQADLDFAEPLPLEMEAWNIPTNLIHDPLIGFTAVRGIRPWLKSFKPWQDLQLGTPPNQAFFWAQGGNPNLHFLAAPSAEASNQVYKLGDFVVRTLNPILATNGWPKSAFGRRTNSEALVWLGVPNFSPHLDYTNCDGSLFLVSGLFQNLYTKRPAPAGLFQYLQARPNLVAYDWENTSGCLESWMQPLQLIRHLLCLPRMTYIAGNAWLVALTPRLTNSITAVELASPTQLSLARVSTVGFTGAELQVLAEWLESLEFPRSLHSFTAPPPPPRTAPTNAPAAK